MSLSRENISFGENLCVLMARDFDRLEFSNSDADNLMSFDDFVSSLETKLNEFNVYDSDMRLLLLKYGIYAQRCELENLFYEMLDCGYLKAVKANGVIPYINQGVGINGLQFNPDIKGLPLDDTKYNDALISFVTDLSKNECNIEKEIIITKKLYKK
jgi:hypothetical protein